MSKASKSSIERALADERAAFETKVAEFNRRVEEFARLKMQA